MKDTRGNIELEQKKKEGWKLKASFPVSMRCNLWEKGNKVFLYSIDEKKIIIYSEKNKETEKLSSTTG